VSVHTLALQPVPIFQAHEPGSRAARSSAAAVQPVTPLFRDAQSRAHPPSAGPVTLLGSAVLAESSERAPAPGLAIAPAPPLGAAVIVARYTDQIEHATCALCWTGPAPMAGSVRRRHAVFSAHNSGRDADARAICNHCLVALEMLAVQFDAELQLHVETPA